jgi:hypothetical protein
VEQKVAKNVTAVDLNVTEYQDYHLLVYDAMWATGYSQTVQINLLSPPSAIKVGQVCFSATFSSVYQNAWHHIPKSSNFKHSSRRK